MKKKRIRKENVVTYLFMFVLIGIAFGGLYFLNVSMTGFAVSTPGPEIGQTTLTLQEADLDNLGDAYVDTDTNHGGLALLKTGNIFRTYIKFNISLIPINQNIDNASLCLYVLNTKKTQLINVHHVYFDFDESTIIWDDQPCGTNFDNSNNCNLTSESSFQMGSGFEYTWICWQTTNMVKKDYDLGNQDISIVLYTTDSDKNDFYSKEYTTDSSLSPYLNVTYHSANQAPTITLVEPQNKLYLDNESLSLNFSVSDSDGNLDSCWYSLDEGENIFLPDCLNATFDVSEGSHTLVVYANDTLGLEINESVSFNVDVNGISVVISEPSGTKSSRTEIPITYSVIGNNLTCWYNLKTSIGGEVIANTTLENCSSLSFDVSADGDYILNLYVNNTLGSSAFDSSGFSVSTGGTVVVSSGGGGGGSSRTIITGNTTIELIVGEISDLVVNPEDIKKVSWSVKNIGTNFLNNCKLKGEGGYASWVFSDEIKNLASGEEYEFIFDLAIPETIEDGKYDLTVSLMCQEISKSSSFVVEILEDKFFFDLIKVERVEKNKVKIVYSLEELSGLEQDIELQFLLFGSGQERLAEVRENQIVSANSKQEFEILIPIESSLEGELKLLVNLNSEDYSNFVQENIILGSPISGFSIFGGAESDNVLSGVFIILFLVFAFFMVRRIWKHRKKKRK